MTINPSSDTQIHEAMASVRALNLQQTSVDELKEKFRILLAGHTLIGWFLAPGTRLHRARKISGRHPSYLTDLGPPPAYFVKSDQRCNRAGESMFYCSSARNGPFFEVHSQVGDRLVLSEWKTTAELLMNTVGFTPESFARLKSSRECPKLGDVKSAMTSLETVRRIEDFFAAMFVVEISSGEEHLYRPSIAITEKFVPRNVPDGCVQFAGLMYPTIAMLANCENYAFRTEVFDNDMSFEKAELLEVKAIEGK